jgi:hypothetical protein
VEHDVPLSLPLRLLILMTHAAKQLMACRPACAAAGVAVGVALGRCTRTIVTLNDGTHLRLRHAWMRIHLSAALCHYTLRRFPLSG